MARYDKGRSRVRQSGARGEAEYFRHPQALVESSRIGPRTRIWAFAHILPEAVIGADCNICDHVFVENDVRIGDRVTIKCGVQLWDGAVLEDDVFVGPNATFSNDRFPRSRQRPARFARTVVRAGASVGANATILPGCTIGRNALVGAGTVVTQDVPANAIVVGNPARISGYAGSRQARRPISQGSTTAPTWPEHVRGVKLYEVRVVTDLRGTVAVTEMGEDFPFQPKRFFTIFDVPTRETRGEHAHKTLEQYLVCIHGECSLMVDDGRHREEIQLNTPRIGVYLAPMVWAVQYNFSRDAVLLVLASAPYDPDDYIRDYERFLLGLTAQPRAVRAPQAAPPRRPRRRS